MKIGYMRVSKEEQKLDRQVDGLKSVCDRLHLEKVSAVADERPIFDTLFKTLKAGDTLVVWDLDRAFRSTVDAILCANELRERGVAFQIVSLNVDTSEPVGELVYSLVAAIAQFERRNISKRTKEGLASAVKRGKILGRKRKLTGRRLRKAVQLLDAGEHSKSEIAALFDVHPRTLSRALKRNDLESK